MESNGRRGVGGMVSQTSLPSGANIPPSLLLPPAFCPQTALSIVEVGGGDARFFLTNLVKDTKIRQHWSRE